MEYFHMVRWVYSISTEIRAVFIECIKRVCHLMFVFRLTSSAERDPSCDDSLVAYRSLSNVRYYNLRYHWSRVILWQAAFHMVSYLCLLSFAFLPPSPRPFALPPLHFPISTPLLPPPSFSSVAAKLMIKMTQSNG